MNGPEAAENKHILIVDDDTRLRDLLCKFLGEHGYMASSAAGAVEARAQMATFAFDLLIVDIMMPGEDGLSLTRSIRTGSVPGSAVPILMLTARGEADDRVAGLEGGADDYLAKPFDPRELLLRIKAILRRTLNDEPVVPVMEEVPLGDTIFLQRQRELWRGCEKIHLTAAEGAILAALAQCCGEFLDRDELANAAGLEGSGRTIDVQITRLRKKIEPDTRSPRYLQTMRGQGYVLRPGHGRG